MNTEQCKKELNRRLGGSWKRTRKHNAGNNVLRDFISNDGEEMTVVTDAQDTAFVDVLETEKAERKYSSPSDYYFQLDSSEDESGDPMFYIVKRSFYDKYHYLDDQCRSENTPVPPGFYDIMEATFEYDGDVQFGRQLLLNAGFVERKLF